MIKLFNWSKPGIKAISLPSQDWTAGYSTKAIKKWGDAEGTMAISLNFFEGEPDLPTIKNIDALRQYYRDAIATAKGGIIEVELVNLQEIQCVRTILKFPQEPNGFTYLTSLIIPFAMCSYVVKIQAPDLEMTGMRESFIIKKLLREKVISKNSSGYQNWLLDPYKPESKAQTLMNRSEEAKWDVRFPSHPLTKSRKLIATIEQEISFDDKLFDLKRFDK